MISAKDWYTPRPDAMRRFDDFDAWSDAIGGASLRLTCDAVETREWTIGVFDLGGVVLQVGTEGGGNICYGGNTHAGPLLFVPLTLATEHVVNGEPLDEDSLFAIPRGADFRIRVKRRAHAWCSIALPFDTSASLRAATASMRVACQAGAVPRLRQLVSGIAASFGDRPGGTAAHRAAGGALVAALADCVPVPRTARPTTGRPRLDRGGIIRRAMAEIERLPTMPTAAELARRVEVTDRTLLRAFQETYGMPPKKYLLLRELHEIRRALRTGALADATVTDVLVRHGIWEFGRFAARYLRHFGELPSETLRRARG